MSTLLAKNIRALATMDDQRRELTDAAIFVRDNVIEAIGAMAELPQSADEVLDLRGHVVLPGLVNTHHHLYQGLTRAVPAAQNVELFDWLRVLYPIWARLTPDMIYTSALLGMAELILSGCTSASDHLYLFPNGARLDDEIRAAQEIGLRFCATRGSMSLGESAGGLPPDSLVENEEFILRDSRRLIETYHDPKRCAMLQIAVAPCSPFSVTQALMRESAALARSYGVRMHTHLAETRGDVQFSLEKFGMTPADYAQDVGWVGADVWHAHCVHLSDAGIGLFARTGTGVAHCPSSNMRLASGIAPIRQMVAAGVKVGLGVDGSASNDSGHLLAEARQAMLLQRVTGDPGALTARQALELGTRGGAAVLGRDDVGILAPGMAADFIAIDSDTAAFAGALHDPIGATVFCAPQTVAYSVINGRVIVREGHLTTLELPPLIARHNEFARQLMRAET